MWFLRQVKTLTLNRILPFSFFDAVLRSTYQNRQKTAYVYLWMGWVNRYITSILCSRVTPFKWSGNELAWGSFCLLSPISKIMSPASLQSDSVDLWKMFSNVRKTQNVFKRRFSPLKSIETVRTSHWSLFLAKKASAQLITSSRYLIATFFCIFIPTVHFCWGPQLASARSLFYVVITEILELALVFRFFGGCPYLPACRCLWEFVCVFHVRPIVYTYVTVLV